ncbi:MAG: hypothetical protein U5K74_14390 [Gemmatimonadaceae bacterium]|nr:hypothetical protein [Gemmatimonadaceae bacterium]
MWQPRGQAVGQGLCRDDDRIEGETGGTQGEAHGCVAIRHVHDAFERGKADEAHAQRVWRWRQLGELEVARRVGTSAAHDRPLHLHLGTAQRRPRGGVAQLTVDPAHGGATRALLCVERQRASGDHGQEEGKGRGAAKGCSPHACHPAPGDS